jgi:hypothetical protein
LRPDLRDPAAALTASKKANEMSGSDNAGFLDTLALAHHRTGDTEKAREIQRRAVSLLPSGASSLRKELTERLREYDSDQNRE